MTLHHLTISKIPGAVLAGCFVLALLLGGMIPPASAQGPHCQDAVISWALWSQAGDTLAVVTNHGVWLYDPDLAPIRSLDIPRISPDASRVWWSPDGEWMILQGHLPPETPLGAGIDAALANVRTGEVRAMIWPEFSGPDYPVISNVVWSPDDRHIVVVRVPWLPTFSIPGTLLVLGQGPTNADAVAPVGRVYEGLDLSDLRWETPDTIMARTDGFILSLDAETLALQDSAPELMPRWWITSPDGEWQAAQLPNTTFGVRAYGGATRTIPLLRRAADRFVQADRIVWMSDSEHLIAVYDRPRDLLEAEPELATIVEGAVVDAREAEVIGTFVLQADGEIRKYAVSPQGDRIVLVRDEAWLELWNPLTATRLATIEVPNLPVRGSCWAADNS